jgi:hypothetical protein
MHAFTDSKGQPWELRITAGTVKRCAEYLKVDIGNPARSAPGEESLLVRFDTDLVFKVDLLYCVLKPEVDARQLTDEQFAECLEGDALQAAHDAFYEELLDFCRSLRRTDMVEAIRRQKQLVARGVEIGAKTLASEETSKVIDRALTALGESAAASLAAAVSSQSHEPSAS